MIKAKEFWEFLCGDLNYKFFTGTPCEGLYPLYNAMDSDVMHYVPTVNERIALGLIIGAKYTGVNGGILISASAALKIIDPILNYNIKSRIPLLVLAYEDVEVNQGLFLFELPSIRLKSNFKKELKAVASKSETLSVPGIVLIKEGVFDEQT
jgi:hypothetical protein